MLQVPIRRAFRDEEVVRDLTIGKALCDQGRNLELAMREAGSVAGAARCRHPFDLRILANGSVGKLFGQCVARVGPSGYQKWVPRRVLCPLRRASWVPNLANTNASKADCWWH